ncbi:MAG TPA: hypothetical protein VFI56_03485, partial [Vicinamibacterales bacterium]|nr:hypothetical protein [Vicinamibacterales bacterium]
TPWLERQERALTIQRDEIYAGQVLKDVAPNHDQGAPAPHGNQLRFVDDFTHRIKMAGYRIWEVPQAVVEHQSRPRGTWLFYYQIRNRWHFIFEELSAAHDRGSDPAAADL